MGLLRRLILPVALEVQGGFYSDLNGATYVQLYAELPLSADACVLNIPKSCGLIAGKRCRQWVGSGGIYVAMFSDNLHKMSLILKGGKSGELEKAS